MIYDTLFIERRCGIVLNPIKVAKSSVNSWSELAGQLAPNQEPGELPRRRKSGFVYQGSSEVAITLSVENRLTGSKIGLFSSR